MIYSKTFLVPWNHSLPEKTLWQFQLSEIPLHLPQVVIFLLYKNRSWLSQGLHWVNPSLITILISTKMRWKTSGPVSQPLLVTSKFQGVVDVQHQPSLRDQLQLGLHLSSLRWRLSVHPCHFQTIEAPGASVHSISLPRRTSKPVLYRSTLRHLLLDLCSNTETSAILMCVLALYLSFLPRVVLLN